MVWGDEVGEVGYADSLAVWFAGRAATDTDPAYPPTFTVACGNTTYVMQWDDQHPCGADVLPEDDPDTDPSRLSPPTHSRRPSKKRR